MLKEDRKKQIASLLHTRGYVGVAELCKTFDVSNMTIRRDLDEMEAEGVIARTHGGANLSDSNLLLEEPFQLRLNTNIREKEAIAREAVKLVESGQKIFICSGTTTFCLAKEIDNSKKVLVGTDSLMIAVDLSSRTNLTIVTIGGEIKKNTFSCDGYISESMIRQLRFSTGFVGVCGIGSDGELYVGSLSAQGKCHAIFNSVKTRVILADYTKFGIEDFSCIGNIRDIEYLVTDTKAPEHILKKIREMGVNVLVAQA